MLDLHFIHISSSHRFFFLFSTLRARATTRAAWAALSCTHPLTYPTERRRLFQSMVGWSRECIRITLGQRVLHLPLAHMVYQENARYAEIDTPLLSAMSKIVRRLGSFDPDHVESRPLTSKNIRQRLAVSILKHRTDALSFSLPRDERHSNLRC